ncbi:MAG: DUF1702 family protein [Cyanobacteria bacterium J083]|nr:MAG: DUF1702 family protein [Cyanobacteria bacterium J083]
MRQVLNQLLSFRDNLSDYAPNNKYQLPNWGFLRQHLLKIPLEETNFTKRGFRVCNPKIQQHLERVGVTFLQGYHAAIEVDAPKILSSKLNTIDLEWRGFAFEGAAMGLALLDSLTPWQSDRVQMFLKGAGREHIYMVHVGVGWVIARLQQNIKSTLAKLDPLLGWLAIDGYGFHAGYFNWQLYVTKLKIPKQLSGYATRVFDQGLGRSLWFVDGADVTCIPQTIKTFQPIRRGDLWSGIGLGCAYAGGIESGAVIALKIAAGSYLPQLAQGAAFAAKARQQAGNLTKHTEIACQILCGMSAKQAAEITDQSLQDLPYNQAEPAYEIWRKRIQSHFVLEEVTL